MYSLKESHAFSIGPGFYVSTGQICGNISLVPEHQTEGMDRYKGKALCIPDIRISSA